MQSSTPTKTVDQRPEQMQKGGTYLKFVTAEDKKHISLDPENAVLQALQVPTDLKDALQLQAEGQHPLPQTHCRVC